jgi:hypothetical protein
VVLKFRFILELPGSCEEKRKTQMPGSHPQRSKLNDLGGARALGFAKIPN